MPGFTGALIQRRRLGFGVYQQKLQLRGLIKGARIFSNRDAADEDY
jgi:hypothetical protein